MEEFLRPIALKPTIIIVEDERAARHSLRMVMEAYGYQVKDYATAEEFLREPPGASSFLILDVNLPGASGLAALQQLRALGIPVPAVLVSGRATNEMRAEVGRLDALAFFEKPIDINALLDVIASIGA
ncbi:response regulator [Mesorhizobium sp.]|uniref:response regulator transcription factor n=1 Tax=Mesorhizobium sp. TaxID=1871066 RepID=UPI000FE67B21|nr:response regulator [Mesorhizobium sp.]RWK76770.1 MAG: response regulator [Mesorhizobium sp.]RWK98755.1 MAG: response regulator [Mesorhizobium sp.]RWL02214.1 MAG: response regulator [Mesorhizobium sp.]TIP24498.1 MAG: response regulator [Mesorhizobium sp.]